MIFESLDHQMHVIGHEAARNYCEALDGGRSQELRPYERDRLSVLKRSTAIIDAKR